MLHLPLREPTGRTVPHFFSQGTSSDVPTKCNSDNRQKGRLQKNILSKNVFVKGAEPFKYSFSDSGVFGVKITGSAAKVFSCLT
jgi:hypothetical protein